MFNELKKKFVFINMFLLTCVFISIFGSIYFITFLRNEDNKKEAMERALMVPNFDEPKGFKGMPHPGRLFSLIVLIDKNNEIIDKNLLQMINEDILNDMVNNAMRSTEKIDEINIKDTIYRFKKIKIENGTKIIFIDVTRENKSLFNLLKTFLIVGFISLLALYVISLYFAKKAIEPIKEVFDKQKNFIADASHELKTPLTIIKTNISLLESNKDDTIKNQQKWFDYIEAQSDRMTNLIDEMLTLAKLDDIKTNINFNSLDIGKILENIILSFEASFYEANINYHMFIQENVIMFGESESIKKLINILLDNAVKHTPNNGEINIYLKNEKNKIILKIENTGKGIPNEHLENIFERFYRPDTSRNRETGGYGLGLSIARSIVNQHNGKIYATSVNELTSFNVEFPSSLKT